MHFRAIGSILIILGTSVGAGMLALPVVTAHESFTMSFLMLLCAWCLSTVGALALLEVCLHYPLDSNLATLAKKTLGNYGRIITWVFYLLLLYSLICAYLSGLSGILQSLLAEVAIHLPRFLTTIIALLLFGAIIYRGIASVDLVNRLLMVLKLTSYFLLTFCVTKFIKLTPIFMGDYAIRSSTFMVMITSFGYAIVIPSLRSYLSNDRRLLIKVVLIGSTLPLFIYALWIFVIQGLVAKTGPDGLVAMASASNTNGLLMQAVIGSVHQSALGFISRLFMSICALTSFLGVSIALTDFIADGLGKKKYGKEAIPVYLLTYVPPLLIVLIDPALFIEALRYAGFFCVALCIVIPLFMLYRNRYVECLSHEKIIPFNKIIIMGLLFITFFMAVLGMLFPG